MLTPFTGPVFDPFDFVPKPAPVSSPAPAASPAPAPSPLSGKSSLEKRPSPPEHADSDGEIDWEALGVDPAQQKEWMKQFVRGPTNTYRHTHTHPTVIQQTRSRTHTTYARHNTHAVQDTNRR